ncbi:response regulator [Pyxidicoccus xibeiensis]|uniref:response regulator n=1 Tax=Pyxidicoccus xibeiensis TaxID=2906759 RepID=UPI0020A72A7F|nr:response regulator [Pyxidicoccus xibeiensis]MCP3140009.1 response regulator [Pyxidicoccus xibeiensis]
MAVVTQVSARSTVLLVEDDPDLRGAMAEALRDEGHEVVLALDGEEGLRLLTALETPCLVLIDLETPLVRGSVLVERLRADARFNRTRVVGLTGDPQPVPPGVAALLRKPVRLETLLTMVRRHCPGQDAATGSGS